MHKPLISYIPLKEKMFFVEHLSVMLRSAIPIDRALATLAEQTNNKRFKGIIGALEQTVKKGQPLSSGLRANERVFGELFINMVAAGETSGKLEDSLKRLYTQLKKDHDLRSKVMGALTYPLFVVAVIIAIGTVVMVYVIPKLIPLFEGFNTALPLPTRVLIATSKFVSSYIIWIALAVIVLGAVFIKLIRGKFRRKWHALILHLPPLGGIVKKINLARFSRTLSTLLSTDILVVEALQITSRTLGNTLYQEAVAQAGARIQKGVQISQALKEYPKLFPVTVQTMVQVGEESGTLTELLAEVAEFYEESVDETTKTLATLIEPILIVILGVAVGGMAIAILTPMYAILQQV